MYDLTPSQQDVVNCENKYCLVMASAGSGKTLVLTERIKQLLSGLQRGEKILALTFTNKAARELRDRLLKSYSADELAEKAVVGTIHSFCAKFVSRRGSTIGLPPDLHVFESVEDRLSIFAEAVEATPQVWTRLGGDRELRQLFEDVGRAKRSREFRQAFFADLGNRMVFDEYRSRMLIQHAVDFDDILAYTSQILTEQPALAMLYQRIYRHICIDEAQDLNDAQYQVIRAMAGSACGITMVGDAKQAIYGFNGSTSEIMLHRFATDYDVSAFTLEENFRSSRAVMRYAKAIEPSFEMVSTLAIEGDAGCLEFDDEDKEAQWVIDEIRNLVTHGAGAGELHDVSFDDCVVLARNRYVFSALRDLLTSEGVPYNERVAAGSAATSESDVFRYFHTGLRLIVNPNDRVHLEKLNVEFYLERQYESFDEILCSAGTYDGLSEVASDSLRDAWRCVLRGGTLQLSPALDVLSGLCDNESAFSGDDERLLAVNDCGQWRQWWERYCLSSSHASRNLVGFLRAISLGEVLDETRGGGVTLSTVHLAKGLEYDVVFVVGMNEGTFPDYRSRTQAQLDEERHSMFVAITRARRICYVTRPKTRMMPWGDRRTQIASRFFMKLVGG